MTFDELKSVLNADQDKAKAFEEALAGMSKETVGSDVEALALAAGAVGFQITPEEIERARARNLDVDEDALAATTGGTEYYEDSRGHDAWCPGALWNCYTAFMHDNTMIDTGVSCWSDYSCLWDFKDRDTCLKNHDKPSYCWWTWETE